MRAMLKTTVAALALSFAASAASAANIVEVAAGDERFSTLVAAVTAADLVDTLSGPGPFTVFAPVNDAFAALPEGTLDTLLKPENKGQLTDILLYHVVPGKIEAGMIMAGQNSVQPALESAKLCVIAADGGVTVDDGTGTVANVVIADIMADNGVIHVVDKVLLPGTAPACM